MYLKQKKNLRCLEQKIKMKLKNNCKEVTLENGTRTERASIRNTR